MGLQLLLLHALRIENLKLILNFVLGDALTIIYTGPMFTMIFSFLFLRIRQGLWKIGFTSLLIPGIILVVRPPFLFPNSDATNGNYITSK